MKHKVSELTGSLLDLAVAMAEGKKAVIENGICIVDAGLVDKTISPLVRSDFYRFSPSTNWVQGGPIIEREQIELTHDRGYLEDGSFGRIWQARLVVSYWDGDTPLIAAMRAHVADKYGEEIELPDLSA